MKKAFQFVRRLVDLFLKSECPMHAAGLTYYSLLAVVPILCCVLVVAKACHVDHFAREQINGRIDALIENVEKGQDDAITATLPGYSEEAREKKRIAAEEFAKTARTISNTLFQRIESFDIKTFGWIGFGFLLWTVVSTLSSVESSFNLVFGITTARPIWKRVYMYLGVLLILPVLAAVAMALPLLRAAKNFVVGFLGSTDWTRGLSDGLVWIFDSSAFSLAVALLFSTLAFAFAFFALPNCRVRAKGALIGGLVTSLLFGGWLKVCAIAQVGIAKSSALYGSFAFLPIVLAWLCMSWQIVLFGAVLVRALDEQE